MRHDITLLAQRRHHTRMPNKRLRQRGLHLSRLSPQGLYQLLRHCSNPRTRSDEGFCFSSRELTGNGKTPLGMLRHRLRMRFGVHHIYARISRHASLQDRDTRVRNGAGSSDAAATRVPAAGPELIAGLVRTLAARRSEKHGAALSPCARYPLALPSPAAPDRTRSHHSSAYRRRSRFGSRNHRF